jgi:methionyl aminopeptidase
MRAAAVRRLPLFKPGRVSPSTRPVPAHIPKPDYALNGGMPLRQAHELAPAVFALDSPVVPALRAAGQLAARALAYSSTLVRPGATTDSIDEKVHAFLVQHSAYPSPLLYMSFPKSCCTSVNDVIVHGIPDSRPLLEGDVCKVDISCYLEGVHGDNCATFCVGEVDPAVRRMVDFARQVLDECVELCGPGVAFNDLGRHISKRCAAQGCVAGAVGGPVADCLPACLPA